MAGNTGSKGPFIQKALNTERKAEIWEMRVRQGISVKGIADMLGLNTSTVYNYLRAVIKEAEESLEADVFRWKLEQHYKYDHIYAESMEAWTASKRTFRRDKFKRKGTNEEPSEITSTMEDQTGDSRYLNAAIAALQSQAKLWGFNAPDMVETVNRNLNVNVPVNPEQAMDAVAAAEAAFRAHKYGHREKLSDGQLRDVQAESGLVVSGVREDYPPDEGEDSL